MRIRFEQELQQLNEALIEMGTLNEKSLELIIQLFADKTPKEMDSIKDEVKEYEVRVDDLERQIQTQAMRLLISQQPVARDLRSISTALNIITDMERISDQAYDIAEITMFFKGKAPMSKPDQIIEMIKCCIDMASSSVDAFVRQDIATAHRVINADDVVDGLFLSIRDLLIDQINKDKSCGEQAIDLMIIAKYLERIADHAVNIAEWVIFNITGLHKDKQLL